MLFEVSRRTANATKTGSYEADIRDESVFNQCQTLVRFFAHDHVEIRQMLYCLRSYNLHFIFVILSFPLDEIADNVLPTTNGKVVFPRYQ